MIPRYLNPTALCKTQEEVHATRPSGDDARRAERRLRKFWPALFFLPRGNIKIRQALTMAGLIAERENDHEDVPLVEKALRWFKRGLGGASQCYLPYIEGWGYLRYIQDAYAYLSKSLGPWTSFEREFELQAWLASVRALPTGEVPDTDTRRGDKVRPAEIEFFTCEAFTVWRRPGNFLLVWHDVRVRAWRFRWNLHVENTFGLEVRKAEDWPYWYTGWENKRVSLWWRFWAPRMEVVERGAARVVLRIGGREKVIEP